MRKIGFSMMVALVLVAGIAGAVRAGARKTGTVTINTSSHYAQGYLGSVRNSTNRVEFIDCYRYAYWTGYSDLWCTATDSSGNSVSCSTETPELIQAASAISGDSFVAFDWDDGGECTEIDVDNGSYTAPKAQ
jgi:hypothetical protein